MKELFRAWMARERELQGRGLGRLGNVKAVGKYGHGGFMTCYTAKDTPFYKEHVRARMLRVVEHVHRLLEGSMPCELSLSNR